MRAQLKELQRKNNDEVTALQQPSHASALAAQEYLDAFLFKTTAIVLSQSAMQTELKVMLATTQQTQAETQAKTENVAALNQWQAWSGA